MAHISEQEEDRVIRNLQELSSCNPKYLPKAYDYNEEGENLKISEVKQATKIFKLERIDSKRPVFQWDKIA